MLIVMRGKEDDECRKINRAKVRCPGSNRALLATVSRLLSKGVKSDSDPQW